MLCEDVKSKIPKSVFINFDYFSRVCENDGNPIPTGENDALDLQTGFNGGYAGGGHVLPW